MKKEILDALKAKFTGVSDTILDGIAERLAKTVTTAEEVKTAVDGVTFQQVLESYGDSRATGATKTAVLNYEKKYGLKDGVKVKAEGDDTDKNTDPNKNADGGTDDMPKWAKSLFESQKKLEERLTAQDRDRTAESRRKQLSDVISRLPESLRKGYERTSVDGIGDDEFRTLIGEISKEVDGIVKATRQKGAVFGVPGSNAGKGGTGTEEGAAEATEAEVKDLLGRLSL
ncbi:MAG: hypothetical protein LUC24_05345 [Bacteroidales bacterium]|nr:hypothetical protein [Bacteroidales bacterium]